MSEPSTRFQGEQCASRRPMPRRWRGGLATVLAAALVCALLVCAPAALAARPVTAVVVCAPTGVVVGQASKCTVTVTDPSVTEHTVPTGSVSFASDSSGGFSATECTLVPVPTKETEAASCSVQYTPAAVGTGEHKITAKYPGDGAHEAMTSAPFVVTVAKRHTSVAVACASPVVVGQPSTCTATVSDTSPPVVSVPTGTVSFASDSSGEFSSTKCTLVPVPTKETEAASCSVQYTPLAVGTGEHKITAKYPGDAEHEALTSVPFGVTVGKRQTSMSVECAPSVEVGQPGTCAATVSDTSPGTRSVPTGTLGFSSDQAGGFTECKPKSVGTEAASCSVQYTPAVVGTGKHKITAEYGGDPTHEPSSKFTTLAVTPRASSVAVSCGPTVVVGAPATCVATVKDASAGGPTSPTGTVSFSSDTAGGSFAPSGKCSLVALAPPGEAACLLQYTPGLLGSGTHTITAEYAGDSLHATASAKGALTVLAATTTTTTTKPASGGSPPPPPPAPSAPMCRLVAKERWLARAGTHRANSARVPVLSVSYSCDQTASVSIEGAVTIAASGHGAKKRRARTIAFAPASSHSLPGQRPSAIVVALGSAVSKALTAHLHAIATIKFTVRNASGVGVATLKLKLGPQSKANRG